MSNPAATRTPRSAPSEDAIASFAVPSWMYRLSGWQERHPRAAIHLGNFDTRIAGEAIEDVRITAPIYIAGLARSGTTVLLELLARHPDVATHKYRDFPPVFTPWLWHRWLARVPEKDESAAERAHGDGIRVTSHSPEAFEETLWMAFFEKSHDPAHVSTLTRKNSNPEFEKFYTEHIRKILAIRRARRYAAKGNYNLMRLAYLQKIFPDARFVLPIRDPVWHIASLMKQQTLFEAGEKAHPRAIDHLRRVGHFEFGLDRRPINPGDTEATEKIEALWANGQEIEGWAHYWALIHKAVADQLDADLTLAQATRVVRYESLCSDSMRVLAGFHDHCDLEIDDATLQAASQQLHAPTYYRPAFDPEEIETIRHITGPVAKRFGYDAEQCGAI